MRRIVRFERPSSVASITVAPSICNAAPRTASVEPGSVSLIDRVITFLLESASMFGAQYAEYKARANTEATERYEFFSLTRARVSVSMTGVSDCRTSNGSTLELKLSSWPAPASVAEAARRRRELLGVQGIVGVLIELIEMGGCRCLHFGQIQRFVAVLYDHLGNTAHVAGLAVTRPGRAAHTATSKAASNSIAAMKNGAPGKTHARSFSMK